MAAIALSVFPSQVDMVKESLDVVVDLQINESVGCNHGESIEHEKSVEQHVISPGQAVEPEPHPPRGTTSPPDNDSTNDAPSSQITELLVPEDPSGSQKSLKPPPSPTSPSPLQMTGFADLTDLALHSPSSQIIGTPFATDSTRFEYPFPEISSGEPSASPSIPLSTAFLPAIAQNDPKIGLPFHSLPAPPVVAATASTSPSSVSLASYGLPHGEISVSYNPAHPKLKQNLNPPVPPSLAKKSKKWSLNLLGRRKSSSGQSSRSSGSSMPSEFSSHASTPMGSVARANLILDGGLSASPPPPSSELHGRSR